MDCCLKREAARRWLLPFMDHVWSSNRPLVIGRHTKVIASELDDAYSRLCSGESSYLVVTVPYRHGKSDLISRHFPPFLFGRNPDTEIILATYGADLSEKMSRDARSIMRSDKYSELFPGTGIDPGSSSVARWSIEGRKGELNAVGIAGGVTGKGADVLIVDDYLKTREAAESSVIRDKIWHGFTNELMTRLAPAHIVVVLATRWHVDDVIGRIKKMMETEQDFPRFKFIEFAARGEDGSYLFPERFSEDWYRRQFATLGQYASAALLQGSPVVRGGNLFKVDRIRTIESSPPGLRWVRYWDLASSVKERIKDDPDRTAGAKIAVRTTNGVDEVFLCDMKVLEAEAPERNRVIKTTAKLDGQGCRQGVESVAGYKDAYTTLKGILKGTSTVHKCSVSGDKLVRAGDLEPVIEAGNFYLIKGDWNGPFLEEITNFPSGDHDDQVDSVTGGYLFAKSAVFKNVNDWVQT